MFIFLLPMLIASDPVPIVGRPADFSGAVGGPFVVTMNLEKTAFPKDHWMLLTISISGTGDFSSVQPLDLIKDKEWNSRFQIDKRPQANQDQSTNTRKFEYHIRAKNYDVACVPRLRFVYFNPQIKPTSKAWQTAYAEPIPITIELPPVIGLEVSESFRAWQRRLLNYQDYFGSNELQNWIARKLAWDSILKTQTQWDRTVLDIQSFLRQTLSVRRLPEGIALFARATRQGPSVVAFDEGLELLRQLVQYPGDFKSANSLKPESKWWPSTLFDTRWYWATLFAWVLLSSHFIAPVLRKKLLRKSSPEVVLRTGFSTGGKLFVMPVVFFALLPFTNQGVKYTRRNYDEQNPPVVVKNDAQLREGNSTEYPVRQLLPIGVEARKLAHRGDWTQIEFASGLVGWVNTDNLFFVFPQLDAP